MENFRPFSDVTIWDASALENCRTSLVWVCQARNGAAVLAFALIGCWTLLCSVLRALPRIRSSGWASGCSSCDLVEQVTLLDASKDLVSDDLISLLGVMTGPAYVRNTKWEIDQQVWHRQKFLMDVDGRDAQLFHQLQAAIPVLVSQSLVSIPGALRKICQLGRD
jgi:hypothetical protein